MANLSLLRNWLLQGRAGPLGPHHLPLRPSHLCSGGKIKPSCLSAGLGGSAGSSQEGERPQPFPWPGRARTATQPPHHTQEGAQARRAHAGRPYRGTGTLMAMWLLSRPLHWRPGRPGPTPSPPL